ncbi:unnamed protein product [Paramecium primaurelia]|uniref:Uncharacterized protein n=1 Tax=Paramecium primaurelia TaxID=5886 RepID=A0A8S1NWM3_PARPR|nr:unnamed protein product [Paramecium primaurelia]
MQEEFYELVEVNLPQSQIQVFLSVYIVYPNKNSAISYLLTFYLPNFTFLKWHIWIDLPHQNKDLIYGNILTKTQNNQFTSQQMLTTPLKNRIYQKEFTTSIDKFFYLFYQQSDHHYFFLNYHHLKTIKQSLSLNPSIKLNLILHTSLFSTNSSYNFSHSYLRIFTSFLLSNTILKIANQRNIIYNIYITISSLKQPQKIENQTIQYNNISFYIIFHIYIF